MTVGLDIDGVVADFITPFLKLLEARSGGGPIDPASITDPNFMQHPFFHFTQEKKSALIRKSGIELFVDDRHENCEDVATETDAVVLMSHRPYNQAFSHPKVRRIHELDEIWDHLNRCGGGDGCNR
jgi:uncharacterized HAD superfamily protein